MPRAQQRQTIEGPFGELLAAPDTNGQSPPHFHSTFAIGVGRSGSGTLFARDRAWRYSEGMVVVTNPYEPHWGRPDPGGVGYSLLYPRLGWLSALLGDEAMHFQSPVIDDPALADRLLKAFDAVAERNDVSLLGEAVVVLFRRHARFRPSAARPSIAAPAAADGAIASSAAEAGLSRSYYSRKHRQATGLSPLDYRRQARVLAARAMIEAGAGLAAAAADAGFADQAHMSRQFRQILGVTPGAYRRQG
ncbi:MAG TPA: helix-turn-helix transcriptional regulator [Allosphingosinicella sp.]|jgi:AraC-like DNA-binding protein|nr:helix-turn-helix transcriptional regulator [Allosphingosinicella sp.]